MFQNDISISVKFQRKKWSQVNMLHVRPFLCDIHIDVNNHSACIPLDFKVEDTIGIQIHMPDDDIECLEVTKTWTLKHLTDNFTIILENSNFNFTLNGIVVHKRLKSTSMFAQSKPPCTIVLQLHNE